MSISNLLPYQVVDKGVFTAANAANVVVACPQLTLTSNILITAQTTAGATNADQPYINDLVAGVAFAVRCDAAAVNTNVYNYIVFN